MLGAVLIHSCGVSILYNCAQGVFWAAISTERHPSIFAETVGCYTQCYIIYTTMLKEVFASSTVFALKKTILSSRGGLGASLETQRRRGGLCVEEIMTGDDEGSAGKSVRRSSLFSF